MRRASPFLAVALAVVALLSACAPPRRAVTGWVPYWSTDSGRTTIDTARDLLSEVSPFWYRATGATALANDEAVRRPVRRGRAGESRPPPTHPGGARRDGRPRHGRGAGRPGAAGRPRQHPRQPGRGQRLRRHRPRLRAVRVRRRHLQLGRHPPAVGPVHQRARPRAARPGEAPDRDHPADLQRLAGVRQRLLGLRLGRDRAVHRPAAHHVLRVQLLVPRTHGAALVGAADRGPCRHRRAALEGPGRRAGVRAQLRRRRDGHLPERCRAGPL